MDNGKISINCNKNGKTADRCVLVQVQISL